MNYFNDDLAQEVWASKYQFEGETLEQFFDRLTDNFYSKVKLEYPEDKVNKLSKYGQERLRKELKEKFKYLFSSFTIVPGGSVLSGVGTNKPVSLSNCYVIDTDDSIEDIFNTSKTMAQIYKRRGGVGVDVSNLRPAGAPVKNAAQTTSGVVPFMELFSQTTNTIGQEGRRGALMISIDIRHPDSPQFIVSKQDLTKITGANISVKISDDFMKAVENDEDYILRWPVNEPIPKDTSSLQYNILKEYSWADESTNGQIKKGYCKKIKAKELWDSIIQCAWSSAEPGILFWDHILDNDPASVYEKYRAVSTNPCQPGWATVLTPEGIKTFNDIEIGSTIWSKDGWTKVINKINSGIKDVYEYRTTRNVFYGTENHRVLDNGVKIEVKDAKEIDSLQFYNIEAHTLDIRDIMDGLVIGDGSVHKASNDLVFLCIGENDKDYFNSEVNSLIIKHRPGLKKTAYEIISTISSNELPLLPIREIPDRFFYGNKEKVRGFLRGLYSANGSVVDKRITLKTSSSKLRDQVQIMLSSIGINSYFTTNKKKDVTFENGIYECKESYDINISTDRIKFYNLIGFLQEYKNDKLKEIIKTKNSGRKEKNPIKTINKISTEEVFDITVDNKSHTYWTGGCNVSNCGEIPLSPYDSCRLIAVNMYNIVDNPFTDKACINPDRAYEIFYEAQVIGDILVDLELDHIDQIISITSGDEQELWKKVREIGASGRRTGVGLLGEGDMYAALGLPYGDEETTDYVMRMKQRAELNASIDLAILEGPFPDYKLELEYSITEPNNPIIGMNGFYTHILNTYSYLVARMIKYGRRNISFSTIAPTGSISILAGTSSGCEPVYSLYYTRRKKCNSGETPDFIDQNGVGFRNFNVIHPKLNVWWNEYKKSIPEPRKEPLSDWTKEDLDWIIKFSPWYNQEAENIIPEVRIRTQSVLQKYVTHSISSTINLANDVDKEVVDRLYKLAHKENLKGVTVYVDGSRSGILVKDTKEQNTTLERPSELNCQVVHFKNEKKEWVAFIGVIDGMPYEIFTGPKDLDVFPIPSSVTEGVIIKVKQENEHSRYDFRYIDSYGYTNTLGGLSRIFDKEYWNYGRLVSGLLRSRIPVEQVVKIVDGLNFTKAGLNNWKSGVIRSLKSFIKDGTKAEGVKCENCGSTHVVYQEGCLICRDCGSSKCG